MDAVISTLLKNFIDKEVRFYINDRLVHAGTLIFAKEKDIYLIFVLKKHRGSKGTPIYIPRPFSSEWHGETELHFSYKAEEFIKSEVFLNLIKKQIKQEHLRKYNFFGNTLTIKVE